MANQRNFEKDPDATVDFTVDWTDWLESDTLSTGTWVVPAGITNVSSQYTTVKDTVFLSGGTVNNTYAIINRISTVGGKINDQTIYVLVKEQ